MNEMTSIVVTVPLTIRRHGGRKQIIGPDGAVLQNGGDATETRGDPGLVKALARAFRWRRMLEKGQCATIDEVARLERISPSYVSRLLRLTLLAPGMVEGILDGECDLPLPLVIQAIPAQWGEQRWALATTPTRSVTSV